MDGERIKRVRERLGLSQERLAGLLGVSFASINRWESESATTGPRGAVLVILQAMEAGLQKDRALPLKIAEWAQHGQSYMLHRLFALAHGGQC